MLDDLHDYLDDETALSLRIGELEASLTLHVETIRRLERENDALYDCAKVTDDAVEALRAEVRRLEQEKARLLKALSDICDDAVGQDEDPLWIVQRHMMGKARKLLALLIPPGETT